jgi:hypothetical protein
MSDPPLNPLGADDLAGDLPPDPPTPLFRVQIEELRHDNVGAELFV